MRRFAPFLLIVSLMAGCQDEARRTPPAGDTLSRSTNSNAFAPLPVEEEPPLPEAPAPPPLRRPAGLYRGMLPAGKERMEQVVEFLPDQTYRLQEHYRAEGKDSVVRSSGTWNPSNGYIWLYQDQLVRARYRWKGDTLQYYSPRESRAYSLQSAPSVLASPVWKGKEREGTQLFAIGNEPFWSVSLTASDSLVFQLADWPAPVQLKAAASRQADSLVYTAGTDSLPLRLVVLTQYCSDGMSDYTYPRRVRVVYNGRRYEGCGALWGKAATALRK
jgi:uncharacterized membrane protein